MVERNGVRCGDVPEGGGGHCEGGQEVVRGPPPRPRQLRVPVFRRRLAHCSDHSTKDSGRE
eukprot:3396188-Alexandrium_andersonii.AAC.1